MTGDVLLVISWLTLVPFMWMYLRSPSGSERETRACLLGAVIGFTAGAATALHGNWLWTVINVSIGAWWLWKWWRRKDRKRAAALVGEKSRALRDAIVKRAKDASRGARPVLRPVPQGSA